MRLTVSYLSLHNLHLLFCSVLSIYRKLLRRQVDLEYKSTSDIFAQNFELDHYLDAQMNNLNIKILIVFNWNHFWDEAS